MFLAHPKLGPEPPLLKRMHARLERSVTTIQDLSQEQLQGTHAPRNLAQRVRQMRHTLRRKRMMPLAKVARPLLKFSPAKEAALRVPHARTDSATLAASALAMAKALAPHTKLFVSAGYPKDVISSLRAEAEALARAAKESETSRQLLSRATLELRRAFKTANETVTVIEGILMPRFFNDTVLEHSWRQARRVGARVGRPTRRVAQRKAAQVAAGGA